MKCLRGKLAKQIFSPVKGPDEAMTATEDEIAAMSADNLREEISVCRISNSLIGLGRWNWN